jgi:acyl CoA:acetate/3-ketoacid CoA transferase
MTNKLIGAAAAAELIGDNSTVAVTGSGGGLLEADAVFSSIESRFLSCAKPCGLTLVHALGIGDRDRKGVNRFAHERLVRRVIGGHWGWSPRMQALARENKIEAYSLPAGVIQQLLREIGAGRPGLFTHIGLGTFVDPRRDGGKVNAAAKDALVQVVEIEGREYLHYQPFKVDIGIVRGTFADERGNIAFTEEPANLDSYVIALAAHNCHGKVIAQVREIVPVGSLPPRSVTIPGLLVDAVVVAPDQKQTYRDLYDSSLSGEMQTARKLQKNSPDDDPIKRIISKRAALELHQEFSLNFGFGVSAQVATLIANSGDLDKYWISIEQGIHGGYMLNDALFGMAHNPMAIVDSPTQFDLYSGGGLDLTFLGMAEMDSEGNVNVSRLNGVINGPGGFIDISQNAKTVIFCGTFDTKGSDMVVERGRLKINCHGKIPKLVKRVSHITFSGEQARKWGQKVIYVTERAAFALGDKGIEITDIAPGMDLQRDVLDHMQFMPVVGKVGVYPDSVMS